MKTEYPHHPPTIDDIAGRNIDTIARMERLAARNGTFGERVADGFAATVGSWKFIIIQSLLLVTWVILNIVAWMHHWDPYPFILLNLALSFQAAYASPIIMMSQNRQAKLDERRNHLDLQINLLAEQETTEILRLVHAIATKVGVPVTDVDEGAFEQETKPMRIIEEIEQRVQAYEQKQKRKKK